EKTLTNGTKLDRRSRCAHSRQAHWDDLDRFRLSWCSSCAWWLQSALRLLQSLVEVPEDVVDVLDADRQADHVRRHPGLDLLFLGELAMGGRCRVDDQRLCVAHVGQVREELQRFDELDARLD